MWNDLKGLVVVLAIALIVFRLAKPVALSFSSEADFLRRRKIWVVLTVTAFLSPGFWWYTLVAVPVLLWGANKDSNPIALYLLLLHVVPPIPVNIPTVGINELFYMDNFRLLAFCILVPTAWQLRRRNVPTVKAKLTAIEVLVIGYGILLTFQVVPGTSVTAILRGAFLFYLDVYLLLYVVIRSCASVRVIAEALATFCLAGAVMAALSIFETARSWLPYANIGIRWTGEYFTELYLMRGDVLRAEVSAGHSLALGVLLALAFGCWLYLCTRIDSKKTRLSGGILLWLGLFAAYSRAPWLGALTIYIVFIGLGRQPWSRVLKAVVLVSVAAGLVLVSPFADRFIKVLPFLGGSVDSGGFDYRERLAERSWELFQLHPFFGDPLVANQMEDLRQGQGIIDFVNGYAFIGLYYGAVGLLLFLCPALLATWRAYFAARAARCSDPGLAALGVALTATIFGELLMIATSGFGIGPEKVFYVLVALAVAYARTIKLVMKPNAPPGFLDQA